MSMQLSSDFLSDYFLFYYTLLSLVSVTFRLRLLPTHSYRSSSSHQQYFPLTYQLVHIIVVIVIIGGGGGVGGGGGGCCCGGGGAVGVISIVFS